MAKQRLCVGIDIGASGIKLCQLKQSGEHLRMDKLASYPLPPETIVEGTVMHASRVVDALKALWAKEKIKEKRVAFAISGHAVIIKKLTLPAMEREELEATMLMEAEQLIPFDIKDVYLDVQHIGNLDAPTGQMNVILVAAKKDYVHEYTSVLREAGLEPVVCDIDAFAIETMFLHNYALPSDKSIALANISASKTTLNILAGGVSALTREISVGGNSFTAQLQRELKISFEQAERFKRGEQTDMAIASNVERAVTAVDDVMDTLSNELQAGLDFVAASDSRGMPSTLYLCGGATRMPGLLQALRQRLLLDIEFIEPFRALQLGKIEPRLAEQLAPSCAIAAGLAMRFAGDC